MSLIERAHENLSIFEAGFYLAPDGTRVELRAALEEAKRGTRLYAPTELPAGIGGPSRAPRIEVTGEKTTAAARRLVEREGLRAVAALNFASGVNPGGGFLLGARAQEEDLCRDSGLYPCLLTQPEFYEANRREGPALCTDALIYSPNVPFFRGDDGALLTKPFPVSILTSPAPNAHHAQEWAPSALPHIPETLRRRMRQVLAVAVEQGHRNLVLGAWGCGAFRNDPVLVASLFAEALTAVGPFDRVVFAVYEPRGEGPNLDAFRKQFG